MNITYQNHIPNELQVLREFLYHAIYVDPDEAPPDRSIIEVPELACYVENWGLPNDHAVFAVDGAVIVGASWTRCFPDSSAGYGTISPDIPELSIALLPAYRGMGIGSRLLALLFEMIENKYTAVSLSVSKNNPAKRLYERFGFSTVDETDDSLLMLKTLKPSS